MSSILYDNQMVWSPNYYRRNSVLSKTLWKFDHHGLFKNGAHLQRFVFALQWVRNVIPYFATIIQPLQEFMEKIYSISCKRAKRAVAKVYLAYAGWNESLKKAFGECKQASTSKVKFSFVYTAMTLTDWAAILTQITPIDIEKLIYNQNHEPLSFQSGRLNTTQLRWFILEKEAIAVMAAVDKQNWILLCTMGFDFFFGSQPNVPVSSHCSCYWFSADDCQKSNKMGCKSFFLQLLMLSRTWWV